MATEAQIQANRDNATKSTGPRTEEGKARVSQNALKHGLLASNAVLPGEDPAEFDAQLAALQHAIRPHDALEHELVRQLADAQWRMRRLSRLESAFLFAALENRRKMEAGSRPRPSHYSDEANTLMLGHAMWDGCTVLAQLARYDAHLGRRFDRAIQQITRLREARGKRQAIQARQANRATNRPAVPTSGHHTRPPNPISPQSPQPPDPRTPSPEPNCETKPIASNPSGINGLEPTERHQPQPAPLQPARQAVPNSPIALNGHANNHPQAPPQSQN